MKKSIIYLSMLIASLFLFFGCDDPNNTVDSHTTEITVIFNANGGFLSDSGSMTNSTAKKYTINNGDPSFFNLPTAESLSLSKNGSTFIGWATEADAATAKYKDGESVFWTTDITLYAIWKNGYGASVDTLSSVLNAHQHENDIVINITGSWKSGDYEKIALTLKTRESTNTKQYTLDFTLYDTHYSISNSFKDLKYMKSIVLSDSYMVPLSDSKPFENCNSLQSISFGNTTSQYESIDGVLYFGDTLLFYPRGKTSSSFTLAAGKKLERYAFLNCVMLTSVVLPNTITKIPARTFQGCSNLASVDVIPNDASSCCYEWIIDNVNNDTIHQTATGMANLLTGDYCNFTWTRK